MEVDLFKKSILLFAFVHRPAPSKIIDRFMLWRHVLFTFSTWSEVSHKLLRNGTIFCIL